MLHKLIIGIMLLILSLATIPATAMEKQGVKTDEKAIEKYQCDGSTAVELRICAEKQLRTADDRLNEAYQKLKSKIDTLFNKDENRLSKNLLIKAQRIWIELRDAECAFSGQLERYGGTDKWKLASSAFCKARMTEERILEIEQYLEELNGK